MPLTCGVSTTQQLLAAVNSNTEGRDFLALKIFQSPTDGLTEVSTRTSLGGEVYEVRKASDDSLATIYSDAGGTTEIIQNGTSNVSGSDGVVGFYIDNGGYYVNAGGVQSNFSVNLVHKGTKVVNGSVGVSVDNTAAANGAAVNALMEIYNEIIFPVAVPLEGVVVIHPRKKLISWDGNLFDMQTAGSTGITFASGAIHCETHTVNLKANASNQTLYALDGDVLGSTTTSPQYNRFYNISTEGNNKDDSLNVLINNSWSNSFYGCYFNRSTNGIQFGLPTSGSNSANANNFYGCELRSVNSYPNGGSPIIHYVGDGNAFIGGIVENWKKAIIVHEGMITFNSGCYIESFASGSSCEIYGGHVTFDNCFRPAYVFIFAPCTLIYTNNDCRNLGSASSIYPIIQYRADVAANLVCAGNDLIQKDSLVRQYEYRDPADLVWKKRSIGNIQENVNNHQSNFGVHAIKDTLAATGDGTLVQVGFANNTTGGKYYDDSTELNSQTGVFAPESGGTYMLSCSVYLGGIVDTQRVSVYITAGGVDHYLYVGTATPNASNQFLISGTVTTRMYDGDDAKVYVIVSGGAKTVDILRGNAVDGYTTFSGSKIN